MQSFIDSHDFEFKEFNISESVGYTFHGYALLFVPPNDDKQMIEKLEK